MIQATYDRRRASLSDLSPLQGMRLTYMSCFGNLVSDLSPLEGMPLAYFELSRRTFGIEPESTQRDAAHGIALRWDDAVIRPFAAGRDVTDGTLLLRHIGIRPFAAQRDAAQGVVLLQRVGLPTYRRCLG